MQRTELDVYKRQLLGKSVLAGAAVETRRCSAQDRGNHGGDHHQPKQQFAHDLAFSINKRLGAVRSAPSRFVFGHTGPRWGLLLGVGGIGRCV